MTDEGVKQTEQFARTTGMRYPFAFDRKGELLRALRIEAYPTAVLVDPAGIVVWKGHPARLAPELVEQHLKGALTRPVWSWPGAEAVRKALRHRRVGEAVAAAQELQDPSLAQALRRIVGRQIRALQAALEKGNYLYVLEHGPRLAKELAGLEKEAAQVQELLDRVDAKGLAVARAQKKLRQLASGPFRRKKDVEKAIRAVEKLAARHVGTYVEEEAKSYLERLQELMSRLRR